MTRDPGQMPSEPDDSRLGNREAMTRAPTPTLVVNPV
jgi:hypothetical protein